MPEPVRAKTNMVYHQQKHPRPGGQFPCVCLYLPPALEMLYDDAEPVVVRDISTGSCGSSEVTILLHCN